LLSSGTVALSSPGDGINLGGGFSLSPFVRGSATYDSNVHLAETNETDDIFYGLVGGLSLLKTEEDMTINLRGWYRARRYQDTKVLDDEIFQENLDIVFGNIEKLQFRFDQRYSDVSDYEYTQPERGGEAHEDQTLRLIEGRTRRTKRQLNDFGGSVARRSDKLLLKGKGGYASVDFDNPTLHAWTEKEGEANLDYEITDKSSLSLVGVYGEHTTKNKLRDTRFTKLRVGTRSHRTDKVTFAMGAGIEIYRAEDAFGTTNLNEETFHYDVSGAWAVTRKVSLQVFGRNEIIPTSAFVENTKEVSQFSLGALWRPFEDWQTTLGGSYRRDDYSRPIDGIDGKESLRGVQWKLGYVPTDQIMNITLNVRYEKFKTNLKHLNHDYDQLRVSLALNLTY